MLMRIRRGQFPHLEVDPFPEYNDFASREVSPRNPGACKLIGRNCRVLAHCSCFCTQYKSMFISSLL